MNALYERNFENFFDFVKQFPPALFPPDGQFIRDKYVFRGQGSADYELCSSFDRKFCDLPVAERVQKYKRLIANLIEETKILREIDLDEVELLGLAQHHGVPTRLLDWSSSPLVAAYFAFNERVKKLSPGRYVSIWALDRTDHSTWNQMLGVQILRLGSRDNDRAFRQSGFVSVITTPHDTIEAFVKNLKLQKTVLWKFNIKVEDAKNAFSFLDACNIRAATLFGRIDGALNTALERLYLEE